MDGTTCRRWPNHLTIKELSARWGCCYNTTRAELKRCGVKATPPRGQSKPLLVAISDVKEIEARP